MSGKKKRDGVAVAVILLILILGVGITSIGIHDIYPPAARIFLGLVLIYGVSNYLKYNNK